MAKLTSSIGICFASSSLYEIHETVSDLHLLLVFQQGLHTNAGNLIYGVRLQVNVGDSLAKKKFSVRYCIALKKKLKKMSFVSGGHFREGKPQFQVFYSVNKVKLW